MEDILKFLAIVGVIAFGIFRQFAKDKEKNAENERTMPNIPHAPYEMYEMEQSPVVEMPRQQTPKSKHKKQSLPNEGVRTTNTLHSPSISATSPPVQEDEEAGNSEFSIHSAEEARRAIIWSEILQRKY